MPTLTPQAFAEKWRASTLKERAAYQEHFIDLCNMLEQPTPAAADAETEFETGEGGGNSYTVLGRRRKLRFLASMSQELPELLMMLESF